MTSNQSTEQNDAISTINMQQCTVTISSVAAAAMLLLWQREQWQYLSSTVIN